MICFSVPGRPVPAVRMTQRSKWVSKQAGRYLAYKNQVAWAAKAARIQRIDGPVEVEAAAYLYGRREPDADNLAKAFLDGLNGIAWTDDRQVRKLTIEKVKVATREEERAEIIIKKAAQVSGGMHE
ncbi:RusA family crossover junction endodeoxyribonuclease [Polycladomyces sp. WAk]|uniref:RusA family crossover junction endodeoxyribonuclease n=1 Tax=Polycladomyces zharkentensis TaxID=2807616 RepID=A0ABS2WHY7_9BACL|nr:RusA family crossover junction endodeoxyribonuclease [Polycladomyces sp. WAk]MBN2909138.1 RusA family crossover junction endodeoxyribonuclease [Polycladomyces sp. WAk]